MALAGITPTASFLTTLGKMQLAGYRLCRIVREARGEGTDGLAADRHGHINRASCEGMATTVAAAHHLIWRHLHDSMHAAQKPKSKLKFVTLDNESNNEHAVATRRVSKNLQQGRAGGEGTGYRGDNTCQKKSRDTVQPRSRVVLQKSFLGQVTRWGRNQ